MDALTIMNNAPTGSLLLKAMKNENVPSLQEVKSAIIDPTNTLNYTGTRVKPTSVPMGALRGMARVPAISAIINTRLNQVASFAKQPRFEGDIGFRIMSKDIDYKMSPADKKEANRIAQIILTTGAVKNRIRRDNFDRMLRKVTRDSLVLDQMCWENVPDLRGNLSEMWALDASTIELVAQEPTSEIYQLPVYKPQTRRGIEIIGDIAYIQRVNGQILAEYTEDELTFAIRNPSTEINIAPFGHSELEDLVEIVTGIVNGVRYNTSYFNHSSLPQGVLEIIGTYKDEHLESFKRQWKTMTSGATGKWAVPVMAMQEGSGFKWTPFKNSNRDMEFNQFLEFLFNLGCAVYQIDPNEVGFKSWSSKSSGGLSQSDNTEVKIEQSQDKGFKPLMTFLGQTISSEVVDRINDEFCLAWEGLDTDIEKSVWLKAKEELEAGTLVVNEYRASKDRTPVEGDWGNAPANATLIQVYTADKQAKAQMEQTQMQGDQQMAMNDKQHGNAKELAMLQHGNTKELQQGDQGQQMNLTDKQHGNAKEMAMLQHKQQAGLQKDIQKGEHGQQVVMADKQHENSKDMQHLTHDQQKDLAKDGQKHDIGMTDRKHLQAKEINKGGYDHNSEMADKQQSFTKENTRDGQKHEAGMADKQHSFSKETAQDNQAHEHKMSDKQYEQQKESTKGQYEHEDKTMDKQNQYNDKAVDKQHSHEDKSADKQHDRSKEMEDHKSKNARDNAEHGDGLRRTGERQSSLFDADTAKPRANRKLKKSLTDIYLLDHPMIERCAEQVHIAWMRCAGTSDNPDIKPYAELHEAVKETDRATARAVIEELLKQGIIPDESKLKKALDTASFEEHAEGTIIVVNPWETY